MIPAEVAMPPITRSAARTPVRECGEPLVPVGAVALGKIITEHQYLLETGRKLIKDIPAELYLRRGAALRLALAVNYMRKADDNYRLVVNTAHRSKEEQLEMQRLVLDKVKNLYPRLGEDKIQKITQRYVFLLPEKDPGLAPHTTGGAVDISLVKGLNRVPVAPPNTPIYAEISRSYYYENPDKITSGQDILYRDNRRLIRAAMIHAGFTVNHQERWHFDFGNRQWAVATGHPAIYGYID